VAIVQPISILEMNIESNQRKIVVKRILKLPESLEDKELISQGFLVAGVDEVGRGCLAGPVVAAAVIFEDLNFENPGILDSKKLTEIGERNSPNLSREKPSLMLLPKFDK
jgi:ribonuclease HIII